MVSFLVQRNRVIIIVINWQETGCKLWLFCTFSVLICDNLLFLIPGATSRPSSFSRLCINKFCLHDTTRKSHVTE